MKIATQTSAELTHVAKLVENIPVAMLTTSDDDGALASRPMTALEMDAQGALWFFTDVQSSKVDHLRAVNLSFTDRDQGAYVSLSGHGEIDTDRAHIHSLWSASAIAGKPVALGEHGSLTELSASTQAAAPAL